MAHASELVPFIMEAEGGYANDPDDRGGATCRGVTLGTFLAYYPGPDGTARLKAITEAQWSTIFRAGYWDVCRCDDIQDQATANALADWAWHSGPGLAVRHVQRILGVPADGKVGPVTLGAINTAGPDLAGKINTARRSFLVTLARTHPPQKKFLRGWLRRVNNLERLTTSSTR